MTKEQQSLKNHFNEIYANKQILLNLGYFLSYFNIKYVDYKNRMSFSCPVHNSDNLESACIFKHGEKQDGNFVCWTHHCEKNIGFTAYSLFKYLLKKKIL